MYLKQFKIFIMYMYVALDDLSWQNKDYDTTGLSHSVQYLGHNVHAVNNFLDFYKNQEAKHVRNKAISGNIWVRWFFME